MMRQVATTFINDWIAVELLAEAPSGEQAEELRVRFSKDAFAAGLSDEEAEQMWLDPDMARVLAKHRDPSGR